MPRQEIMEKKNKIKPPGNIDVYIMKLKLIIIIIITRRRIFGPKRDANVECRRFYIEKVNSLYRSSNIIRRLRWRGHVAIMEEDRSVAFKILTGTLTGKRP